MTIEEIKLSNSKFISTIPTNEEIREIYSLAERLFQPFASEIGKATYEIIQKRRLSEEKKTILRLYDARNVWRFIYEYSQLHQKQPKIQIIGVRDRLSGNLQSIAVINLSFGNFIHVKNFTTVPNNIIDYGERVMIKGTGKLLMELIVKYSINLGFDGMIKLVPKERSVSFYTQIGFQRDHKHQDLLILTPEKALEFLVSQSKRGNFDYD
jgi:hypothetical protein